MAATLGAVSGTPSGVVRFAAMPSPYRTPRPPLYGALSAAVLLAACSGSEPAASRQADASQPSAQRAAPVSAPAAAASAAPSVPEPLKAKLATINDAQFGAADASPETSGTTNAEGPSGNTTGSTHADGAKSSKTSASKGGAGKEAAPSPTLVKAEVLLARANFSPGQIDGLEGSNLRHAVASFATANGLSSKGDLTREVWDALGRFGQTPVATVYTISQEDAAGPFAPVTDNMVEMSKLKHVGYTSPREMLAEKFHMSEDLLSALNPGADFGKAGTVILVAQTGPLSIPKVDHIQVDKAAAQVRAYDANDKVLAVVPATVGSTDRPSPSGVHKVNGVANDPTYTYDPKKLSWGPKAKGKFVVPSGPNNPVGVVWIDLDAPSYGLHGTPDPKEIGKTASHGCVRMTNWDAKLLASAVKPGVTVSFVNSRG